MIPEQAREGRTGKIKRVCPKGKYRSEGGDGLFTQRTFNGY